MERLITHECIHGIVEDVSYRFSDMLTVTSAQLGKLSRSLSRYVSQIQCISLFPTLLSLISLVLSCFLPRTERESCKQLRVSWNELYEDYMTMKNERDSARNTISELRLDLVNQVDILLYVYIYIYIIIHECIGACNHFIAYVIYIYIYICV